MDRACGTYGREERCVQGFSGETRSLEKHIRRSECNIATYLLEVVCGYMD